MAVTAWGGDHCPVDDPKLDTPSRRSFPTHKKGSHAYASIVPEMEEHIAFLVKLMGKNLNVGSFQTLFK